MSCFIDVEGLIELEKQEKWEDARQLLYNEWASDKLNSGKLLWLLSESWYVLSLWDSCIDTEGLSYKKLKNTVCECTEFGLQKFQDDMSFLCIVGYMASILPYLFYGDEAGDLYSEWEQKGRDMLLRATRVATDNLISKVLYLGSQGTSEEYLTAKIQLRPMLGDIFVGHTAIEEYFRDILSN